MSFRRKSESSMKNYYIYILASRRNGTLYIGVTNNLINRVWDHKNGLVDSFTKKYKINILVWFQATESIESAIQREKRLKEWKRKWKLKLIEEANPEWEDLYFKLISGSRRTPG